MNFYKLLSVRIYWSTHLLKHLLPVLFLLFCINISYGQKEGYTWYFGGYAGLNFNNSTPTPLYNSSMFQYEGCATISDSNGNLLFYTNGMTVWNKNHSIMSNGTGLLGGYTSSQSSVIVKKPGTNFTYYIFTVDNEAQSYGFRYSIVDMSQQSGLGSLISKNIFLLGPTAEKVTAVDRAFDNSIWVITHGWDSKLFYAYLITDAGLNTSPVISNVGSSHEGSLLKAGGYMKASPDGNKLAVAVQSFTGFCEIFDFNNSTGIVSNPIHLSGLIDPYGLEFSPNGTKLYISSQGWKLIYQFDLSSNVPNTIINSKIIIDTTASQLGALQVAINGKIYVARDGNYLGIINNPNAPGTQCNYNDFGLYLGGRPSKFGLPTFNQSYFFNPDFTIMNTCHGDSTEFTVINPGFIDSLFWNFGDPITGSENYSRVFDPVHIFSNYGNFTVSLISYHNALIDTIIRVVQIDQNPTPEFFINDSLQCVNSNSFQFYDSSTYIFGDLLYNWDFGDSDTSTSENPIHVYNSYDTFYPKLVVTSFQGCKDSIIKAVYVVPSPDADYLMNDTSQCFDNNNFIFTNISSIPYDSLTYYWDFGDGGTSTAIDAQHGYTSADTFSIKLVATSSFGCKDSISKLALVHVHPMPVSDFSINDSSQCLLNNNFTFTNNSSISSGTISYLWEFSDGYTNSSTNTTHNFVTANTYKVKLISISDFGCKDTLIKSAYVHPMPIADLAIDDTTQCLVNNIFRFLDQSIIGSGSLLSIWDFGDNDTSHSKNPSHIYTRSDTFEIELISRSTKGCTDTATGKTYVYPMPEADFSINEDLQCIEDNHFIFKDLSGISSGSINYYYWDLGDGTTINSKDVIHIYSNNDTFTVKFLISSSLSCIDTVTKTVYVYPNPTAEFLIDTTSLCLNENNFFFLDKSTIPYGSIDTILWKYDDGNIGYGKSSSHSYSTAGQYKFKLIITSDKGCKDSTSTDVYVRPMPNVSFTTNDSSQCLIGNTFNFNNGSNISSGTLKYLWSLGDSSTSSSTDPIKIYSYCAIFTVKLLATSNYNCKDSITRKIRVNQVPVADFSINDNTQCLENNNFVFSNNSYINSGKIVTNLWDFGDENFVYSYSANHQYKNDSVFLVQLKVESDLGCKDSIKKNVVVHPMPHANFNNTITCLEEYTHFTDRTMINLPDIIESWKWSFGDSNMSNDQNPSNVYTSPDIYTVKLHVTSNNQCFDSVSKVFRVHDYLDSNIITKVTVLKEKVHVYWTAPTKGNPMLFVVERSGENLSFSIVKKVNNKTFEFVDNEAKVDDQSYSYRVTIIDSCNNSSPYTNIGKSILLKVATNADYPILTWTRYEKWVKGVKYYDVQIKNKATRSYETLDVLDGSKLTYTDEKTKVIMNYYCYRVIAYSAADTNISYSNEACVAMPMSIWLPNSFTPNHDEINDLYEVKGKYILEYQIRIYNKWGAEVFRSFDIENHWDGKFKGKVCPVGLYHVHVVALGTLDQRETFSEKLLLLR